MLYTWLEDWLLFKVTISLSVPCPKFLIHHVTDGHQISEKQHHFIVQMHYSKELPQGN
jgi:hypothetical protein